jgi:ribosome-associated heat shock protein Hsp15
MESEKLRIDKYLWAIRMFKTRSLATEACAKGKVKENGDNVKASKNVRPGDEYEVRTEIKKWKIKVVKLLHQRVQYAEAIKFYTDITPEEEINRVQFMAATYNTGKRMSKVGRPTKKNKRDLDEFMKIKE